MKYSRAFVAACISGASLASAAPVQSNTLYPTSTPSSDALSTVIDSTSNLGPRSKSNVFEGLSGRDVGENKIQVRSAMVSYQGTDQEVAGSFEPAGTSDGTPDSDSGSIYGPASNSLPNSPQTAEQRIDEQRKVKVPTTLSEPPIAIEEPQIVSNSDIASDPVRPASKQDSGSKSKSKRVKRRKKKVKTSEPTGVILNGVGDSTRDSVDELPSDSRGTFQAEKPIWKQKRDDRYNDRFPKREKEHYIQHPRMVNYARIK